MSSCRATNAKGWAYLPGVESPANSPTPDGLLLPMAGCSSACVDRALTQLLGTLP